MKIENIVSTIIIVGLGTALVAYFLISQNNTYQRSMTKRGDEIVYSIEIYKAEHGYYPQSLYQVFDNNKQVCEIFTLRLLDSNSYELSFRLRGGSEVTYQSQTRTWDKRD